MISFSSKKEILDLKRRHDAEVNRLKSTLSERDYRIQMEQKTSATALKAEKARHDSKMDKLRKEMKEGGDAWKAYCEKLQEKYDEYIGSKLLEERERKKQNIGLERALAKHKKELSTYKRRLGNALSTSDRRKEQVAKLKAELTALRVETHQDQ